MVGFHILLGGADSLDDIAIETVRVALNSSFTKPTLTETVRNLLADYVGEQSLLGVKLHLEKLRKDAPDISRGYLTFLTKIYKKLPEQGYKGLMLIFDEINGLATKDFFPRFLKNLVDENALNNEPIPLLLMVCGTEERFREMTERHRPMERIFEIARLDPMTKEEMREFFSKAFNSVGMKVEESAMELLCRFSGGLPKLMHLLGDAAFWTSKDLTITEEIAVTAVYTAAEEIGRKFVSPQVYRALKSDDYHRILTKLAKHDFDLVFNKKDVEKGLSIEEQKKFNNFLQRMKKLNVIVSGERLGEYTFCDRLTRFYMRMVPRKNKINN